MKKRCRLATVHVSSRRSQRPNSMKIDDQANPFLRCCRGRRQCSNLRIIVKQNPMAAVARRMATATQRPQLQTVQPLLLLLLILEAMPYPQQQKPRSAATAATVRLHRLVLPRRSLLLLLRPPRRTGGGVIGGVFLQQRRGSLGVRTAPCTRLLRRLLWYHGSLCLQPGGRFPSELLTDLWCADSCVQSQEVA